MSALDTHIELADQLKRFEREFVAPLRNRRDAMWEGMKGTTPNEDSQMKYDRENDRLVFLESMTENVEKVMRGDVVRYDYTKRFLNACDEFSVMKDGKFRLKLLGEQSEGITGAIDKLKEAMI